MTSENLYPLHSSTIAAKLTKFGIGNLWHFTHINNVDKILESGRILSARELVRTGCEVTRIADKLSGALDVRVGGDKYVHLTLTPNSLFYHGRARNFHHAWISISLDIFETPGILHSIGNAMSPSASKVPFLITSDSELAYLQFCYQPDFNDDGAPIRTTGVAQPKFRGPMSNICASEVLVPGEVVLSRYCTGIYAMGPRGSIFVPLRSGQKPRRSLTYSERIKCRPATSSETGW